MNLIDTSSWVADEQHAIFPVGARDKQMLWSPNQPIEGIKPNWPYLFKESINRYPDQYWTEVVTYIISKYLDIDVPKAYPAFKIDDGELTEGSLIEWFYDVESERYMPGGVFFKRLIPDFDDKLGKHHNFKDFITILRALKQKDAHLADDIYLWFADMALFDCLIGNTDRHQENWGVIFRNDHAIMAPLFDNGTSMGHERFPIHTKKWQPQQYGKYVAKGNHHLRFTRDNLNLRIPHSTLVEVVISRDGIRQHVVDKIEQIENNWEDMVDELLALTRIPSQTPISEDRFNWMITLLTIRLGLIKEVIK